MTVASSNAVFCNSPRRRRYGRVFYNLPVRTLTLLLTLAPLFALSSYSQTSPVQSTGFDSNFRGVSVSKTHSGKYAIWVSGTKGTILRSLNGGKSWQQLKVTDGTELDFRDVKSFGETTAYLMSSGDGEKSRIYKTTDGGKSWTLQFTDKRAGFFLDSLACDSRTHCFALSDPVEGKFLILATNDGQHWKELPRNKMPPALPTEGAFAASETSIAICKNNIYFGTGGPAARIFHSASRGRSWTATETPMASGNASSGIFSVACHGRFIIAVGGDYREPTSANKVAVYSTDSGATWHLAEQQPGGYRSAVAFLSGSRWMTVGTNGSDISDDAGVHWRPMDGLNLNAISLSGTRSCAVGPKGTVVTIGQQSPLGFFHKSGLGKSRLCNLRKSIWRSTGTGAQAEHKVPRFALSRCTPARGARDDRAWCRVQPLRAYGFQNRAVPTVLIST